MSTWNTAIAEEMERISAEKIKAREERAERLSKVEKVIERKPFNAKKFTRNKFEVWTDIDGYDGMYKVSSGGRVWSAWKDKLLSPVVHPYSGYLKMRLKRPSDGEFDTVYLHRLVALHFLDNPHNKPEVNHNDGNKLNCSVYNLAWMTREENMRHAQIHGLGNVKLKPIEVKSIYYLSWASDMTQDEIGDMYGVSRGVISAIKNRNSWEFCTDSKVQAEMGLLK